MMFFNTIPLTSLAEQWLEDSVPPDTWLWHLPNLNQPVSKPMPDDMLERYLQLIQWLMWEAMWDQKYRLPRVSHREYQLVLDHCLQLEAENNFLVPNHFTGIGFPISLEDVVLDAHYARFPDYMRKMFQQAGYEYNPTSPIDDPRHPHYNVYEYWRNICKPKPALERGGRVESNSYLQIEDD